MFDIGMFEILLVFVIILLVVGPERFPQLIRQISRFFIKAKKIINKAKY